jgi:hypothetical protein
MRGGQKWFDTLPDDYLSGARKDSVTTQHLIGLTDGNATAMLAHRQAFSFCVLRFASTQNYCRKELLKSFRQCIPVSFRCLKLPFTRMHFDILSRLTHDLGVVNMATVEPGLGDQYLFDYAIRVGGKWDSVTAWHLVRSLTCPSCGFY